MHIGHFLLFIAALVILAVNVPWWAMLIAAPLVGFGVLAWLYEASIVLPVARRLVGGGADTAGESIGAGERSSSQDEPPE